VRPKILSKLSTGAAIVFVKSIRCSVLGDGERGAGSGERGDGRKKLIAKKTVGAD
jgi:hypothetical protein